MNRTPDPQRYSMYAAFRTKERGEQKARKKQESIYELNRPKRPTAQPSRPHDGPDTSAGIYRVSRTRGPMSPEHRGGRPTIQQSAPSPAREGVQGTPVRRRTANIYGTQVPPKTGQGTAQAQRAGTAAPQAKPSPSPAPQKTAKPAEKTVTVGTRVQNKGDDAYRYGFHSSYRTADGRILDGFDNTGRPIYRESGASSVVRHVGSDVDVAKLHPVRRIRVETQKDTKKKPFPLTLVLIMAFCTVMVMGVLYSYMRLNECTNTLSSLNYQLSRLRNETNTLTAEVVRREDLIAIEQTAADTLGMVKNDVLTKRYVSIENEDKTEIFDHNVVIEEEHDIVKIDLKTGEILAKTEAASDEAEETPKG